MMSDDTRVADSSNMGELAERLDTLDDFFDDHDVSPISNGAYHPVVEQRENLYDQQALPILHRSLKRNASVTSFQTGFASSEVRYPPRQPPVMTPGAFAAQTTPQAVSHPHLRSAFVQLVRHFYLAH